MSAATTSRASRRPLRNPLAAAGCRLPADRDAPAGNSTPPPAARPAPRAVTLAEFHDHLRTVNSREGRSYADATISAYIFPAKALDA